MKLKKKFYCCNVTAEWELFETQTKLYPSIAKLKKDRTCWKYCGICEITITGKAITKGRKEKFK